MFIERELLKKTKDLNLAHNYRNNMEQVGYCQENDACHKKATSFDVARSQVVAKNYFDKSNPNSIYDIYPREKRTLLQAFNNVNKNLTKLQELGERNWSCTDIKIDKNTSSVMLQPRRLKKLENSAYSVATPSISPSLTPHPSNTVRSVVSHGTTATSFRTHTVKIYSPKEDAYIERRADVENKSLQLAYNTMRTSSHMQSFHVSGAGKSLVKPFESVIDGAKALKPYTVSAETYQKSWIDPASARQYTSGYESAKFDIVSHGNGQDANELKKLYRSDPRVCNRVKSITQYAELTKLTAPKFNAEYQNILKSNPWCFTKSTSLCNRYCDTAKSHGPFYKMF